MCPIEYQMVIVVMMMTWFAQRSMIAGCHNQSVLIHIKHQIGRVHVLFHIWQLVANRVTFIIVRVVLVMDQQVAGIGSHWLT